MNDETNIKDLSADENAAPSIFREAYFSTLFFFQDLKEPQELNRSLLATIREERDSDGKGIVRSNAPSLGGWHSQNEMHLKPEFSNLVQHITSFSKRVSTSLNYDPSWPLAIDNMWSIINPPGSHNQSHIHPNSLWSGVYYVQSPEKSGRTKFTDPRTQNLMQNVRYDPNSQLGSEAWTDVFFQPTPGRIVLFPSWIYHSVETNLCGLTGDAGERVIVSFNLYQKRA